MKQWDKLCVREVHSVEFRLYLSPLYRHSSNALMFDISLRYRARMHLTAAGVAHILCPLPLIPQRSVWLVCFCAFRVCLHSAGSGIYEPKRQKHDGGCDVTLVRRVELRCYLSTPGAHYTTVW